jgi:DNA-directed RNA polymerase subunit RPC12/RpoP
MKEKLIELMEEAYFCSIENLADHLISRGVVVREKGEWELYWDEAYLMESYRCSICKEDAPTKAETMHDQVLKPFCPNCGADMRGGENDG